MPPKKVYRAGIRPKGEAEERAANPTDPLFLSARPPSESEFLSFFYKHSACAHTVHLLARRSPMCIAM
jgi:hypothetical protein